jgi:hypothetical protein
MAAPSRECRRRPRDGGRLGSPVMLGDLSAGEVGGELVRANWPDGTSWHASLGTLRLHAITSAGMPATGTEVILRDTHYTATADGGGDLSIADLEPGPYWLQVVEPRFAELKLTIPTPVTFLAARDSTFRATLTVPTAEEYVIGRCMAMRQWKVPSAMLVQGKVMTPSGTAVNRASLTFAVKAAGKWDDLGEHFTTGTDGLFQSCNPRLKRGDVVRIRIHRAGLEDADTTATLDARLTVVPVISP